MTFPIIAPQRYRPAAFAYGASASDPSDLSSYSFSSLSIGTAASDRYVIAAILIAAGTVPTITSATIGGVAATALFSATSSFTRSSFYIAAVPTGTTATLAFSLSSGAARAAGAVWSVTGLISATPSATAMSNASTGAASLVVGGGGFVIGASNSYAGGATHSYTWAGITEQFDTYVDSNEAFSGASSSFDSTQSVSVTATPSVATSDAVHIFAAWR